MEGSFVQALCGAVDENSIRLVTLQLPPGMRSTPAHVVSFLSSCHAAVMVLQGETGPLLKRRIAEPLPVCSPPAIVPSVMFNRRWQPERETAPRNETMRFDDNFAIRLVDRASGATLPEVEQNGKAYVVGKPGVEFNVKISQRYSVAVGAGQGHVATIELDGVPINYSYTLSETRDAVFDGFKEEENGRGTLKPFRFAPFSMLAPDAGVQEVENPEHIKVDSGSGFEVHQVDSGSGFGVHQVDSGSGFGVHQVDSGSGFGVHQVDSGSGFGVHQELDRRLLLEAEQRQQQGKDRAAATAAEAAEAVAAAAEAKAAHTLALRKQELHRRLLLEALQRQQQAKDRAAATAAEAAAAASEAKAAAEAKAAHTLALRDSTYNVSQVNHTDRKRRRASAPAPASTSALPLIKTERRCSGVVDLTTGGAVPSDLVPGLALTAARSLNMITATTMVPGDDERDSWTSSRSTWKLEEAKGADQHCVMQLQQGTWRVERMNVTVGFLQA
eukprot:gene585-2003_t